MLVREGRAESMHQKVEHPWTVESLAVACGMSRSAFAVRFKDLVGKHRWNI